MSADNGYVDDREPHLAQFILWTARVASVLVLLLLGLALLDPSRDTIIACVATLLGLLLILWARSQLHQGNTQNTLAVLVGIPLALTMGSAIVLPSFSPTVLVLPIVSVAMSLPYVTKTGLRRLMALSWFCATVLNISSALYRAKFGDPLLTRGIPIILGTSGGIALIFLLLWQHHSQVHAMLASARIANANMLELHSKLERQNIQLQQDVEERERAAALLQQSEEQFRLMFEIAPIGKELVALNGRTINANPAFCETLGYTLDELRELDFERITYAEDIAEIRRLCGLLLRGEMRFFQQEKRCVHKDGRIIPTLMHCVLVRDTNGKPLHFVVQILDISAHKQAEEERRNIERKLMESQKLESIGLLAGGIAHDFNNLLTSILGNAELALYDVPSDSPAALSLAQITLGAQRAAELTHQILAYAGKGRFVVGPIDINRLLQEMAELLRVSIAKNTTLQYTLAPNLPLVEGDASQIRQVVMNLLLNASEALGTTRGTIDISTDVIRVSRTYMTAMHSANEVADGEYVRLCVTDSGSGMDEETLRHIFEPFFTTKFTGRGLGLAAVHGIVRSHGGALRVESAPRRGTRFEILLPCASISAVHVESITPNVRGDGKVLVVDDEASVRDVARRMLEMMGFTVLSVADPRDADIVLREYSSAVVAALVDLTMPQLDGEQVAARLRAINSELPIILMSGYSEHDVSERYASLALHGVLQKPFSLQSLQATFQSLFHVQLEEIQP